MQVELTEREIELMVHMLTESVTRTSDGKTKAAFSVDEIILLEKLEQSLKIKENAGLGYFENKRKYFN